MLGALVVGGLVLLVVIHPVGGTFFAVPEAVSPPLVGLALLGAGPFLVYALDTAEKQRDGLAPVDSHAGLGSWAGLTAMGVAIPLVALLAAIRPVGWRLPLRSAAAAAALWGVACLVYPDEAGSEGRVWGGLAIAWAAALIVAGRR